ncbi:MAG: TlpA family protein disulfide reductase [Odoribacteraceae bacterium]|jgi:thiol-disulfide isomerase/thioredoxin|nr:TlpA family protein disulfide reductase [Odoribacteraceae bacterium]
MKAIYLAVIILLMAPAMQAQQETNDPKTWSAERIARAKQVKFTTISLSAEEQEIARKQLGATGTINIEKIKQGIAGPQHGDVSPALVAEDIDGQTVTLDRFAGRYVLIDVWATWCSPCRAEIPFLQAMEERFKEKDIAFVSVSVDADKEKWSDMVKNDHMTGTQLWIGQGSAFADAYAINAIPRFILLDKEGKIISSYILRRPSGLDLAPTLEALLDGKIDQTTAIAYLKNGFPRESMVGKPSPAFHYPDATGRTVDLADFRGQYVLVDLWATWCGFCIQEIPHLKALEEKMAGRAIAFVSISVDTDKAAWERYLQEHQLTGVQLYAGADKSFTGPYDVAGIPRFILLDREGNILDPNMKLRPSNPELYPFLEKLDGM